MVALSPTVAPPVRVAQPQLGATISDADAKAVGEVADELQAIAAREHIDFVFVPITGTSAQMLESKTAEAVAPFVASADARRRYDLTSTLMISAGKQLVLAVLKGQHPKLVAKVNAGIAAIQADGTFAQIEAKWRGSPQYSEPEPTPTCRSKPKFPTSLDCPPAL